MKNHITNLLLSLGDSADEIAKYLTSLGIKGETHVYDCPIGKYLASHLGQYAVQCNTTSIGLDDSKIRVRYPAPVQAFLDAFDEGKYPELRP